MSTNPRIKSRAAFRGATRAATLKDQFTAGETNKLGYPSVRATQHKGPRMPDPTTIRQRSYCKKVLPLWEPKKAE